MENKYKRPVDKGIDITLLDEKIDLIQDPVWKHTIYDKNTNKTKISIQRFAEMKNSQLIHVANEAVKRWNNADLQQQIYQTKLDQIEEEFQERGKKFVINGFNKLANNRNANLKSFSDQEFLVEFKRRCLIKEEFYDYSFNIQADIHKQKQLIK